MGALSSELDGILETCAAFTSVPEYTPDAEKWKSLATQFAHEARMLLAVNHTLLARHTSSAPASSARCVFKHFTFALASLKGGVGFSFCRPIVWVQGLVAHLSVCLRF